MTFRSSGYADGEALVLHDLLSLQYSKRAKVDLMKCTEYITQRASWCHVRENFNHCVGIRTLVDTCSECESLNRGGKEIKNEYILFPFSSERARESAWRNGNICVLLLCRCGGSQKVGWRIDRWVGVTYKNVGSL